MSSATGTPDVIDISQFDNFREIFICLDKFLVFSKISNVTEMKKIIKENPILFLIFMYYSLRWRQKSLRVEWMSDFIYFIVCLEEGLIKINPSSFCS